MPQAREDAAASAAEGEARDAVRMRAEAAARAQRLEAAEAALAAREAQLQERERRLDAQVRRRHQVSGASSALHERAVADSARPPAPCDLQAHKLR